jgi:hypothetical protein
MRVATAPAARSSTDPDDHDRASGAKLRCSIPFEAIRVIQGERWPRSGDFGTPAGMDG